MNKPFIPSEYVLSKLQEKGIEVLTDKSSLEEKKAELEKAGFKIDYLTEQDGRLYAAVFLEDVRLIDNVRCE